MKIRLHAISAIAFAAALALDSASPRAQWEDLEDEDIETIDMSFEACLAHIRRTSAELGLTPVNILETDIARIVRFSFHDGYVLVTCSAPDRKMVILKRERSE